MQFLGVAGFDRVDAMQTFIDTHDLHHMPHAATEDGALFGHFGLNYQPAWVLLDAQGSVVFRAARPSMSAVRDELEALATAP